MTKETLENKIGFQLGFLMYSGKSIESTIEHLVQIAEDYANQFKNTKEWVKIEKLEDMPTEDANCFIIDKVKGLVTGQWLQAPNEIEDKKAREFWLKKATHYMPMDKPEPPTN